jgi:hypothetical protein
VKIQNAFRFGLFGGLGVLVAIGIGGAITSLATILTYVGAALFLALGVDPLVSWLEKHGWKRPVAILVVLAGILGVVAGFVLAIIPVIIDQVGGLIESAPALFDQLIHQHELENWWNSTLPWLPFDDVVVNVTEFFNDNLAAITGGVLTTVLGIAAGAFGAHPDAVLRQLAGEHQARPLPAGSGDQAGAVHRHRRADHGLGGPLRGRPGRHGSHQRHPVDRLPDGARLVPRRSDRVRGAAGVHRVPVLARAARGNHHRVDRDHAALAGGTLLGVLGALIAIPVAAAILLIVKQVIIPRQNEL